MRPVLPSILSVDYFHPGVPSAKFKERSSTFQIFGVEFCSDHLSLSWHKRKVVITVEHGQYVFICSAADSPDAGLQGRDGAVVGQGDVVQIIAFTDLP